MSETPEHAHCLNVAVASMAMAGQTESGDCQVVKHLPHGVLVAAIDGLGHGPAAAEAANLASRIVEDNAGEPVAELVDKCHRGLRNTRGVAMTIASVDCASDTVTWVGVGNVDSRLFRAPKDKQEGNQRAHHVDSVLLRGGIVGYRLPPIHAATIPIKQDDLLILATDGIAPSFADAVILSDTPKQIAERIMQMHRKQDDALVLAARYVGSHNDG